MKIFAAVLPINPVAVVETKKRFFFKKRFL